MNERKTAYALTRIAYGVIFLFYGIGKFRGGLSNFVGGMNQQFSGKLPAFMVMPFAYVIPFAETISGVLIVLGLFTRRRSYSLRVTAHWIDIRRGHAWASTHSRSQPPVRTFEFRAALVYRLEWRFARRPDLEEAGRGLYLVEKGAL